MSSSSTYTTVVCHGAKDLRVEKRELPQPSAGEAQVAVLSTGLCGSDVHYYTHGANGDFKIIDPLVLGHESSGVITAVGPDVSSVKVGDRVAIEAGIYCKACRACKEGRYNLCKNMKFASSAKVHPHLDGTLRERMNHPATLLHKLPDSCSFEAAALAEPLSVVIHAIRRSKLQAGERVLVLGAGAVGLLAASLAKASGATTVVAVDIEAARLEFAQRNGWATSTYCLPKGPRVSGAEALEAAKGVWEELKADTSVTGVEDLDQGFDVVFECTGVESCMQAAVFATRPGGRVLYVGMGTSAMLLPTGASLIREVDIMGVFRYANTYPAALALLGSGQLGDVEKMVTQRYPLERAEEAFQDILRGKDQQGNMIVKVMVEGPKQ